MKNWVAIVEAMQKLANELGEDLHKAGPLLQGILITLFHAHLLRRVIIDDVPYIAHVAPGFSHITVRGMDNPLENESQKNDLRAVLREKDTLLVIERNMGPRQKDYIERSIDDACMQAGREMMRTEDYCGPAGRQFASSVQTSVPCFGNAFQWTWETSYNLEKFKTLEIVTRPEKKDGRLPTFDLILRSS